MASITAGIPTSRYRAPVPPTQRPPLPPTWTAAETPFRGPPPLWRFVVLSILLHALLIALFGAPSGGSSDGQAMWGSMSVELRGMLLDSARAPYAAPRPQSPREAVEGPPAATRADRSQDAVPLTPPAETQAAAVAPSGPAIVEVPTPFPPLLDRVRTEVRLDEPPPLRVPPPTAGTDLRPPPRERPVQVAPVEIPEPLPVAPSARPERVLAEPPAIASPVLTPVPAPAPIERTPPPAATVPPTTKPVEAAPVEVRSIPVPTLEGLAMPRVESPPVELAPMPEIRALPAPAPAPERAAPPVPATPPASTTPPASATSPGDPRGPSDFRREAPARKAADPSSNYDPTAPPLDVDAMRKRAGQIAREGTGQRALLPFAMPPVPAKKSQIESALENARKPDCRTAYQGLGLLAAVPLIANEFGEGNCTWNK